MNKLILAIAVTFTTFANAQQPEGTLKKIFDEKAIVLGVRDQSVPFSYMDDNNKPIGYSIEICMKVVAAIKKKLALPDLKVVFQPATPATRIPLMANGTMDLECSTATNNAARQKQVAFSNTIFLSANTFAAKKSSNIRKIEDLQGKTVAAPAGTTNMTQLSELNASRKLGMRIIAAKDMGEGFLMLETDRISALISDDALLASFIANSRDPKAYEIASENIAPIEPYGLMMRKDDPEFKSLVDSAVANYFGSSAAALNYERWFMKPVPPKNINLNLPMRRELQKAYAKPTDSINPADY